MKRQTLLPLVFLAVGASTVLGQDEVPTTQRGILNIYQEEVKLGMDGLHAANEAGWPAALAKAGSPGTYLALVSMTGTSQVWYTSSFESYAKEGELIERNEADPVLTAELARLWQNDGQFLESGRAIQLVARPDLGHGSFADLTKDRFWDITTFRVRPGHEPQFEAAAKTYGEVSERLGADVNYRVYQVTAGMSGVNFMLFSSVDDYADFDEGMAVGNTIFAGMTDQERAVFETFSLEAVQTTINNRFRLDAGMSYVDAATRAADPEFWGGH